MLRPRRAAVGMLLAIAGLAALLQWIWAGWSVYGPGPSAAMRWLLTGAVGAALLLPPAAGMAGAAAGRWLAGSGLREPARVTRRGVQQLMLLAMGRALGAPLLAVVGSAFGWLVVVLTGVGGRDLPGPAAIGTAHALVAVIAAAFGLWGLALAGTPGRRSVSDAGIWAPPLLALLVAGPALVGPLLPYLARPERLVNATLVVNPVTAVGAALGMDLLRSPHVYDLTRAPEYWYTYPSAVAVGGVYLAFALLGAWRLRRVLEWE